MKRVLLSAYACDPSRGSEPGNGWNWALGLAQKGFHVDILTNNNGLTAIEEKLNENNQSNLKLKFHYIHHSKFWSKAYYWNFLFMYMAYWLWQRKIYKYAKNKFTIENIDVVHHVTWGSLKIGSKLYKLGIPMLFGPVGGGQKTPLIYKDYLGHDYFSEWMRNVFGTIILKYNPLSRGVLKNCKILVTNQDTMDMVNSFALGRADLVFDAAINQVPKHTIFKNNNGKLKLLWVGRIYGFKGLRLIIAALSKINEKDLKRISFTIVGDGPDRCNIEKMIFKLNLERNVHFTGLIPYTQVNQYYKEADVFIYTSLRDSFPSQILEAQCMMLPVITLSLHGQDLMVKNENGIKCSIGNPEKTVDELAQAITFMLINHELRIFKGAEAFKHAQKQTWSSKIDNVCNQYYPQ
jgi:glycosyltransferase involved in cell wall biosynthesis